MKEYQARIDKFQDEFYNKQKDDYSNDEPLYFNEPIIKGKKIYPNDLCPCGSGKKYKKCCGKEN